MLTPLQKESFDEKGYCILDNVFYAEDLIDFKNTFLTILASVIKRAQKNHSILRDTSLGETGDDGLIALYKANPEYISIFQRIISRTPEFFRLSSTKAIFSAIRELMKVEKKNGLYLLSNGIIFSKANSSRRTNNKKSYNIDKNWHQDTFFTIPKNPYLQIWCPVLQKSTFDMGTLVVCSGSHKDGYGKQVFYPDATYNYRYSIAPEELKKYDKVIVELEVGQVLIFHGRLIHASGLHTNEKKIRVSMIGICHNAEKETCVPVSTHYLYHQQTPESWFYELYQDEKAKEKMFDQLAPIGDPIGGI